MSLRLADVAPACFQGIIPSYIATCSGSGEPNVTPLSQVHLVDDRHVALSCQFFNKTHRNVLENGAASVILWDPLTFDQWRLALRFDHLEKTGPLFDRMALRIQAIASHIGMSGVFRLLSADVYEVVAVERVEGALLPRDPALDALPCATSGAPLTELRGLQIVSDRILRARDLDGLLSGTLAALDELLGFSPAMVLVPDETGARLFTIASRGYGEAGIGAEVCVGEGIIGTAAAERTLLRVSGVGAELRYGRASRRVLERCSPGDRLAPEVPLPGLPDAQAQLALPLLAGDRLAGVLAVESRDPLRFDEWDEAFLQIVANQIAMGMERVSAEEDVAPPRRPGANGRPARPAGRLRRFRWYPGDDCLFVDGEYLIRNVPGKILWKVLQAHRREGRTEFTNRELRLDPGLGLPPVKDNLESRLILLRKRLQERCPEVRLAPVRRGRFALELDCAVELEEGSGLG